MARDDIHITLIIEDEIEKLKPSEEVDKGPLTSKKPLDEKQIQPTKDETQSQQSKLTEDVNLKLKSLAEADRRPPTSDRPLIEEVTHILRLCYTEGECKRYFKPTYVALGPLNLNHEKKPKGDLRFEKGEERKRRLAARFINLTKGTTEDFYKNVKNEIDILKNCYNFKGQKWEEEDWAFMFLVDGCALLHFIVLDVKVAWRKYIGPDDLVGIERVDFFLLENQLPYRLLEILIDSFAKFSSEEKESQEKIKGFFKESINEFINRIYSNLTAQVDQRQGQHPKKFVEISRAELRQKLKKVKKESINDRIYGNLNLTGQQQHPTPIDHSQPHHFYNEQQEEQQQQQQQHQNPVHLLDLLRRRLMGINSKKKVEKQERINEDGWLDSLLRGDKTEHCCLSIRNVRELKEKGIRFKPREKVDAITDIEFNDCGNIPTLMLAPIFLHNTTMPLLLNLMAYELCLDFEEDCKITSYLSFLDSLIDNGEDVKELRDAGVLQHGLGSDKAVAELFNKISGILVPNPALNSELNGKINAYCNSNKSHFSGLRASIEAKLAHTYFRSPWTFLVFLGALAGLIMTAMQTYYSFHHH